MLHDTETLEKAAAILRKRARRYAYKAEMRSVSFSRDRNSPALMSQSQLSANSKSRRSFAPT